MCFDVKNDGLAKSFLGRPKKSFWDKKRGAWLIDFLKNDFFSLWVRKDAFSLGNSEEKRDEKTIENSIEMGSDGLYLLRRKVTDLVPCSLFWHGKGTSFFLPKKSPKKGMIYGTKKGDYFGVSIFSVAHCGKIQLCVWNIDFENKLLVLTSKLRFAVYDIFGLFCLDTVASGDNLKIGFTQFSKGIRSNQEIGYTHGKRYMIAVQIRI